MNKKENAPLYGATKVCNTDIVRLLLKVRIEIKQDASENTPLYYATMCCCTETVPLLPEAWTNLGAQDQNGNAPLHKAVRFDHLRATCLLLTVGAAASAKKNNSNNAPIHTLLFSRTAIMITGRD